MAEDTGKDDAHGQGSDGEGEDGAAAQEGDGAGTANVPNAQNELAQDGGGEGAGPGNPGDAAPEGEDKPNLKVLGGDEDGDGAALDAGPEGKAEQAEPAKVHLKKWGCIDEVKPMGGVVNVTTGEVIHEIFGIETPVGVLVNWNDSLIIVPGCKLRDLNDGTAVLVK